MRRSVNHRVKLEFVLLRKTQIEQTRGTQHCLLKGRDFESRGRSFKARVNAFQFENGDADSWTRLSHLRLMQPDATLLSAFDAA